MIRSCFQAPIIACIGIIALAAFLMLLFLGEKSLWFDEAFSVTLAQQDWATMWQVISETEANQGLYYVLLSLWVNIGTSEFIVRVLSVIFALSCIPFIYLLGKRLFGVHVGLIAALLLVVNAFYVHYAQEARGYSLAVLFVTASSYFFVRSIQKPSRGIWIAYLVTIALAVYAHFFSLMILVVQVVSLFALHRESVPWRGLLVSGVVVVLLLSPLAAFVLTTEGSNVDFLTEPSISDIGDVFLGLSGSDQDISIGNYFLLLAYFIPCSITLCLALRTWSNCRAGTDTWHYAFLLFWLFIPIAIAFVTSYVKPIFDTRYFIVCLPPLVLMAAVGLSRINRQLVFAAALVTALGLSGYQLSNWYQADKEDWRAATSYVASNAEVGDAIVFFTPYMKLPFDYYLDKENPPSELLTPECYFPNTYEDIHPLYYLPEGYTIGSELPEPDKNLGGRLVSNYDRVWLVRSHDRQYSHLRRPEQSQIIEILLQSEYVLVREEEFQSIRVAFYETNSISFE